MLLDSELQKFESQLEACRNAEAARYEALQTVLEQHETLVESYRSLKSDCEEEKEAGERYEKPAQRQEKNLFVLLLVDGDGYVFNDHFVSRKDKGGIEAANALQCALHVRLHSMGLQSCSAMALVYANMSALSKALSHAKLSGPEKRSLAPFAASFTRTQGLFDFVDAGDEQDGAEFKIREMFRMFADNDQCKHIFLAVCHDKRYLSMLTPYKGMRERFTLIRNAAFQLDFTALGLQIEVFPNLFRSTPLGSGSHDVRLTRAPSFASRNISAAYRASSIEQHNRMQEQWPMQRHHSRQDELLNQRYNGKMTDHSTALPIMTSDTQGLIPINKHGQRIDVELDEPSPVALASYHDRNRRLCNDHHLKQNCPRPDCAYDHGPVDDETKQVMRTKARAFPCKQSHDCRSLYCYSGHVCIKPSCAGHGKGCRLHPSMHNVDTNVSNWLAPSGERPSEAASMMSQSSQSRYARQDDDLISMSSDSPSMGSGEFLGAISGNELP